MKLKHLKTHYATLAIAGVLLLTVCGCNPVISKRPVGEQPARIVAKEWEGHWVTTDGAAEIKVVDANKGVLKVFWLEDDNRGNPGMKTAEVELRESGGWLFASTLEPDKSRGFVWARIKNENREIIIWSPDAKSFAHCVRDGVFPGKIAGDEVLLDDLKPQHLKIITSGERGVLFSWDEPTVFVKVGN